MKNYWIDGEQHLIENFELAQADDFKGWCIHHRNELSSDGKTLFTVADLKRMNLYYNRPHNELIYLRHKEHAKLHGHAIRGITLTEEQKKIRLKARLENKAKLKEQKCSQQPAIENHDARHENEKKKNRSDKQNHPWLKWCLRTTRDE